MAPTPRSNLSLLKQAEALYTEGEYEVARRLFHRVATSPRAPPLLRARALGESGSCWDALGCSGTAVDDWSLALLYAQRAGRRSEPFVVNIRRWLDSHVRHPRVFISYAHLDKDIARRVHSALARSCVELEVVRDEEAFGSGASVQDEIDDHLARCNCYLVIWSHNFAARPFTTYEVESILKLMAPRSRDSRSERRALLIRVDDTELPDGWRELLYLDARGYSAAWIAKRALRALVRRSAVARAGPAREARRGRGRRPRGSQ